MTVRHLCSRAEALSWQFLQECSESAAIPGTVGIWRGRVAVTSRLTQPRQITETLEPIDGLRCSGHQEAMGIVPVRRQPLNFAFSTLAVER